MRRVLMVLLSSMALLAWAPPAFAQETDAGTAVREGKGKGRPEAARQAAGKGRPEAAAQAGDEARPEAAGQAAGKGRREAAAQGRGQRPETAGQPEGQGRPEEAGRAEDADRPEAAAGMTPEENERRTRREREMQKHERRLAQFDRMEQVAGEGDRQNVLEKVKMLREKEQRRHERALAGVEAGEAREGSE